MPGRRLKQGAGQSKVSEAQGQGPVGTRQRQLTCSQTIGIGTRRVEGEQVPAFCPQQAGSQALAQLWREPPEKRAQDSNDYQKRQEFSSHVLGSLTHDRKNFQQRSIHFEKLIRTVRCILAADKAMLTRLFDQQGDAKVESLGLPESR